MPAKNTQSTNFRNIFRYFIFAICSAFLFSLITNTYYINVLQNKTQVEYENTLSRLPLKLETVFEEVNQTSAMLSISKDTYSVMTSRGPVNKKDYMTINSTVEALQKMQLSKSLITSTFIVHRPNYQVIGGTGTSSIDEYFDLLANYDTYDTIFWKNLGTNPRKYVVLKPSIITNTINGFTQEVIPTIQFSSTDLLYQYPVVINIDQHYFDELLLDHQLTHSSLLYIYDKRGSIIADNDATFNFELPKHTLIDLAKEYSETGAYTTTLNNSRYMIVSHNDEKSNYTYIAVVPYKDFVSESLKLLALPMIILILGLFIVTLISYFLSRKIYKPIQSIIKDNQRLKDDLNLAIPYVCERYLLSIFNKNEIMKEEDVKSFLAGYDFSFPSSHFMVIQTMMNFTEDFFETHSRAEYNAICQGGLAIATEAFAELSHSYTFSVGINQICVILNLDKNVLKADLMASIQDFHKEVDDLEPLMTVHSGIGRLYEGYVGMQKSYQESMTAGSQITYMSTSMIRTYSKADDTYSNSHYSIEEENKLVNYLLQGDLKKVTSQLSSILDKNINSRISVHALKELYLQLYNTAVRVMNTREISIYDIMGEDYADISSHMSDVNTEHLHDYIVLLFERVIENTSTTNEKYDMANLKGYLEEHYCDEIYLDSIAEYFDKSPKYMSKFIKKTLGTTFQDYISTLRINKAKELLLSTSESVNSISEQVGFNSRHPFIRKFKILEGVTPTQYRKLHK